MAQSFLCFTSNIHEDRVCIPRLSEMLGGCCSPPVIPAPDPQSKLARARLVTAASSRL